VAEDNLAKDPDHPQLRAELAYLTAAARLYTSMAGSGDPAFYKALEGYAAELEVREGGLSGPVCCGHQMPCSAAAALCTLGWLGCFALGVYMLGWPRVARLFWQQRKPCGGSPWC